MSRMKHRSAEYGRAAEDQSAAKPPKHHIHPKLTTNDTPKRVTTPVEDIDLRVTRQEGPGYSYGHCQKPGAKLEDGGPKMGLRPGYGLRPVVTIIIMVELVV